MPTTIVKPKPRSTSPPNRNRPSTARKVVPFEISVRVSVWLIESFRILAQRLLAPLPQVLAHAVEDHDGVVDAVAHQREQRGDHVERDLEVEERQEAEADQRRRGAPRSRRPTPQTPPLKRARDVDELEQQPEHGELDRLLPQLGAHDRARRSRRTTRRTGFSA